MDIAIAEAVTLYELEGRQSSHEQEVLRLGQLAHELRNSIASAILSHQMIERGSAAVRGPTSQSLSKSLERAGNLIDRSLSEVRLESASNAELRRTRVLDIVGDVEATVQALAASRGINLIIQIDPSLEVDVDWQLLDSALSNLVQNAMKFTKAGGKISIRGSASNGQVLIEVEDQCGGLPEGKKEELFKPYVQKSHDRTGVELGLSITQRAVLLNKGNIEVENLPGRVAFLKFLCREQLNPKSSPGESPVRLLTTDRPLFID